MHFVKKEIFELGKIEIESPQGQMITCYNAEWCICDLLKNKDKEDLETVKYAITKYLQDKQNRDLPKLVEYSKKLNNLDEVNRYLRGVNVSDRCYGCYRNNYKITSKRIYTDIII